MVLPLVRELDVCRVVVAPCELVGVAQGAALAVSDAVGAYSEI
jgi:hypothetical protein